MREVTNAFLSTIRGSHLMTSRARVLTAFQSGVSPTGTSVDIIDGNVTSNARADIRSQLSLTVDGTNLFPTDSSDLYTPYGNEIFVERGIAYGDGTLELVSLGYYRINTVEQDDAPDGPILITGVDRMAGLIDGRLEAPQQFVKGTSVQTVFETLVQEIYPLATIDFDFDASSRTLRSNHIADEDRYGFLNELAKSYGKIMYWDYRGRLQVRDIPETTDVEFTVDHGRDGVLVKLSRHIEREGVYNAVVALGEQPSTELAPVRAVARDMNPDSPTYYLGRFGKVPRFFVSPFITTVEQAQTAAENILSRALGIPYSANFTAVPNPALEVFDPIKVTYAGDSQVEIHVIESLTIPLRADGAMVGTTRERTNEIIEVE